MTTQSESALSSEASLPLVSRAGIRASAI